MKWVATLLSIGALLLSTQVSAQNTPREREAMQAQRLAIEAEARQHVESLFGRLCPGRCELVEVKATMERPQAVGMVAPGFDEVTPGAYEIKARQLDVTVLLDSKLPRNFQNNIPRMLQYRIAELAPVVNIRPEVLDFPEPQLQPLPPYAPEPPRRAQEPLPLPEARPAPEPVAPPVAEPAPVPEPAPGQPLWQVLLPWIALLLTLLILSALILLILRRLDAPKTEPAAQDAIPTPAEGAKAKGMPDVDKLRADLKASRAVQNRVLRRWISDDPEAVATLVRMLGPEILSDLKSDPATRAHLEEVSDAITRNAGPVLPEEAHKVVDEAWARLTAVRVLHQSQGMSLDWEFLEGMSIPNVRRVLNACSVSEKGFVMGQLPPVLRAAYLEGLSGAERRQLLLGTGAGELLTKQQALDLATRLRKAADEISHIGPEAQTQALLVLDMLRALTLADQEDVLRDIHHQRPDVAQAVLSRVCLETTCLTAPHEVLADAMHRTPVETMTAFLRGTRDDIRDHLMVAAPNNTRQALESELSLEIPVGKGEFLAARETFTGTVADILRRDGHDVASLNTAAISAPLRKINRVPTSEAAL